MRFLSDPSMERGRVVISKDAAVIAMAPSVDALAVVYYSFVVGDELRAHPDTMPDVRAWVRRDAKRRSGL